MKHYAVINTKVVREVYRIAADSKTDAVEQSKSLSPTETQLISEKREVVVDISPIRELAS